MTEKETAYELCNKFYEGSVFYHNKKGHLIEKLRAKDRAKICVGEIIHVLNDIASYHNVDNTKSIEYYNYVLIEIHGI